MKKIIATIFSMQFAGMLMLLIGAIVGFATFIENDLGTTAAKDIVYSARWFEVLLFVTCVSLVGSIFKYRLLQRKKYSVLLFHLGFAVILTGAFITRYFGYEGIMQIREGETSNTIKTISPYIQIWVNENDQVLYQDNEEYFSPFRRNSFSTSINAQKGDVKIKFRELIPNAAESLVEDPGGTAILTFVTTENNNRENIFLKDGAVWSSGSLVFNFNADGNDPNAVHIQVQSDTFMFMAPYPVTMLDMMQNSTDTLAAGNYHEISLMKLYSFQGKSIVFDRAYASAKTKIVSRPQSSGTSTANAIIFDVEYDGQSNEVAVFGAKGMISEPSTIKVNDAEITIGYGSKDQELPFSLMLIDFELERYPGSMSPSSFASEVMVIDESKGLQMPYRIFMNNILNYGGFRFFQSSYDTDEKGTVLSVNHDKWGTIVTYLGYFILALGLVLNFFSRSSRFQTLVRNASRIKAEARKITPVILGFILASTLSLSTQAQSSGEIPSQYIIDKDHAASFGSLLVQGTDGRIKPINTMSSEILRKIYRKNTVEGLNADQVFLGMHVEPGFWQAYPMIKVSDAALKGILGINSKYASFYDFIDAEGNYKLSQFVDVAYNKSPAERGSFDKDIIKVDERVNIIYMVFKGEILTIFPKSGDPDQKWYHGFNPSRVFDSVDAGFVENIQPLYYSSVSEAIVSGEWDKANEYLGYLKQFQRKYGSDVIPASNKTNLEILYNKVNIFKRLFPVYSLLGLLLLIIVFTRVLSPQLKFGLIIKVLMGLIFIAFLLHTAGLAARWYIAGRAPWSNGYETMIYISWGVVLSGIFFARNSKITLATTAILSSLTLMVANLSWLDPEITNLVPVLKSYWLVIHVAVITASYSFLAIGALLGFLNLLLINFMTPGNKKKIKLMLEELTNIIEMNLIIGVFLITIGTFLGAVWANESWGRYWGWDPKETWALVTVLVYSFVVHMRLIPGMNGTYAFNFASLVSFSSVLMTYFGVNYFLSGMHSYAAGDAVQVPNFVYWAVLIIAVVSIMAYLKYRKMQKL